MAIFKIAIFLREVSMYFSNLFHFFFYGICEEKMLLKYLAQYRPLDSLPKLSVFICTVFLYVPSLSYFPSICPVLFSCLGLFITLATH